MNASKQAIAHVTRLRRHGFEISFFNANTASLGILCIAEKGDALFFVYPNGIIEDHSAPVAEGLEDLASYEEEVRAEYAFAIGA